MESNEVEAITNNVLGTRNVVEAAVADGGRALRADLHRQGGQPHQRHGRVEARGGAAGHARGAGARPRERQEQRACLPLAALRGAVRQRAGQPGQRGAVLPAADRRGRAGDGHRTPRCTRYFMTIPEAVQLVLQAAALGKGGEVFVLDMGEPVRIVDLAHDLIRLSGLEAGTRHRDRVYTGLRPGEKLFEELFLENEDYSRTRHEKIFVCRNGAERVEGESSQVAVDALIAAAQRGRGGGGAAAACRSWCRSIGERHGDTVMG